MRWIWLGLAACTPVPFDDPCAWPELDCEADDWPPNVLLVIMDDVGTDLVSAYGFGHDSPPTPTLDALAEEGLVMERAYAYPWCSPTRAALLTGERPRTWGLGRAVRVQDPDEVSLALQSTTLPERLDRSRHDWSHALIGKWHLTRMDDGAEVAPLRHGFDTFRGHVANLYQRHAFDGQAQGFYDWERIVDGAVSRTTRYATTQTADDAIAVIDEMPAPWFVWLAFHAAHEPFQPPPEALHSYGNIDDASVDVRYKAMVEALDTELGRILDQLPPEDRARTVTIVMGDNGTSGQALTGPLDGLPNKSSVFELGIRVPVIVHWPGLAAPGRRFGGLIQAEDVHATIAHLARVPARDTAGRSFLRLLVDPEADVGRDVVISEVFEPNGSSAPPVWALAARDDRYKLIERASGPVFYDLEGRDFEGAALATDGLSDDAQRAFDRLSTELAPLRR